MPESLTWGLDIYISKTSKTFHRHEKLRYYYVTYAFATDILVGSLPAYYILMLS